jgi:hypothetical protein
MQQVRHSNRVRLFPELLLRDRFIHELEDILQRDCRRSTAPSRHGSMSACWLHPLRHAIMEVPNYVLHFLSLFRREVP